MAFLEKLNKLAKNIEDKTGDAIEITKFSTTIATEENGYRNDIKTIGEFYYNLFINGGQVEAEILPVLESAKAHMAAADEARKGIEAINAENAAAKAAAKAEKEAMKQAAEMPADTQPEEPVAEMPQEVAEPEVVADVQSACPSCGANIELGAKFCGECGHKMEG